MKMATALFLVSAILSAPLARALPPEVAGAWEEDLRTYLAIGEANHLHLYHTADRDSVRKQLEELIGALPALDREQALVGLLRLARQFGDGHTAVSITGPDA